MGITGRHWIGEKRGWKIEGTPHNSCSTIKTFYYYCRYWELHLIFENCVLLKVIPTNRPKRWMHFVYSNTLLCIPYIHFCVCSKTLLCIPKYCKHPDNCYHICTVMQLVNTLYLTIFCPRGHLGGVLTSTIHISHKDGPINMVSMAIWIYYVPTIHFACSIM